MRSLRRRHRSSSSRVPFLGHTIAMAVANPRCQVAVAVRAVRDEAFSAPRRRKRLSAKARASVWSSVRHSARSSSAMLSARAMARRLQAYIGEGHSRSAPNGHGRACRGRCPTRADVLPLTHTDIWLLSTTTLIS